jgi:hypothetical protein
VRDGTVLETEEKVATHTVLALLDDVQQTAKTVHTLQEAGFSDRDISVVMRDWSEEREPGASRASLIRESAIAVGVAGAAPGLLATMASLLIPGLGWVRAIGLLMAVLGAIPGVGFGLAVGAIGASNIPEEQLRIYEERLKKGQILLAVRTRQKDAPRAKSLLSRHGAQEIFCTV